MESSKFTAENKVEGEGISKLNDVQIRRMTEIVGDSLKIPKEHRENFEQELKALREFYKRGNPNIGLIRENSPFYTAQNKYANPPSFRLKSLATGIETTSSTDMDQLLRAFNL